MINNEFAEVLTKVVRQASQACRIEIPDIDYGRVIAISSVKAKKYDIVDCSTFEEGFNEIANEKTPTFEEVVENIVTPALEAYEIKNAIEYMGYNFIVRHNVKGIPYPSAIIQFEKNGIIEGFSRIAIYDGKLSAEVLPCSEKFAMLINQNPKYCDIFRDLSQDIIGLSVMINILLKEKPEQMVYETKRSRPSCNMHKSKNPKNKKSQPRKIVVQKVIKFNADLVPNNTNEVTHSTHNITCPCWGVIGHWRTYKSGKRVWIKPHVRGKFKDAYETKEYQMP